MIGSTAPVPLVVLAAALLSARPADAQTDYYNTDTGRPTRVEDAYATERFALDLHLAPLTVERHGGRTAWTLDPEIAYGLLPRTQIELGVPLAYRESGGGRRLGLAGLDLTALYNFNVETGSWPAVATRAGALLPVGRFAPEDVQPYLQGMATRTYRWARFHANVAYAFGDAPAESAGGGSELSRWMSGLAIDRTFPLSSFLVAGEIYASQPLDDEAGPEWTAGTGLRYQLSPLHAFDAGLARRFTGDAQGWSFTFGLARVLGVRVLPPGFGRWGR